MEEIRLSPLKVTGISSDKAPLSKPIVSMSSDAETNVVSFHHCDESGIPWDARKIDLRHWILYKLDWSVTKHVFELLRVIGQAEIDNNTTERLMKPICLGRKNYLFCGSKQVAKNTSLIYSIIESCKMDGLRLVKYIADVLRKLVFGDTDYMALLPMNIAK